MNYLNIKTLVVASVLFSASVMSAPITGYDVNNASVSGTGGWGHSYNGTITPTTSGFADYTGGTGTMADGIIGSSVATVQLFCETTGCGSNSPITPTITLFLDGLYSVNSISIFGGDHGSGNSIPGALTGFDVTIGSLTASIVTSQFGNQIGNSGQLFNDLGDLVGTGLEFLATNQIILSNFTYLENGNSSRGRFSIAEIEINSESVEVTAPATVMIFGSSLLLLAFARRSKK